MGARFSYILVIEKDRRVELLKSVSSLGRLEPFEECYTMTFELDEALSSYLKQNITRDLSLWKWIFFRKKDYPEYFPTESTGTIGCIYLDFIDIPSSDLLFSVFSAATTGMSWLFLESKSVREFFDQLARSLDAHVCFVDLEDQGYRLIVGEESDVASYKNTYDQLSELDQE